MFICFLCLFVSIQVSDAVSLNKTLHSVWTEYFYFQNLP